MAKISNWQIVKTLVFTALGAAPGAVWIYNGGRTEAIIVTCLCTFVGFALSLPGVSVARVAGGTAGAIIAHNAPRSMRGQIMDAFVGDSEPPETPPATGGDPQLGSPDAKI